MIRCVDNTIYTGITTNIEKRMNQHFHKEKECAKYTLYHTAQKLEGVWEAENRSLASKLEYHIKRLSKEQKEQLLINNNLVELLSHKLDITQYHRIEKNY